MFSGLRRIFSPQGSGKAHRNAARRSVEETQRVDAILNLPSTPPSFPLTELGNKVLVTLINEGFTLFVKSVVADTKWVGPATPSAPVFDLLMPEADEIDRQRFIDYVYNFKNVVYDLSNGSFVVVDPNDASDIVFNTAVTVPGVMRAAFGRV